MFVCLFRRGVNPKLCFINIAVVRNKVRKWFPVATIGQSIF